MTNKSQKGFALILELIVGISIIVLTIAYIVGLPLIQSSKSKDYAAKALPIAEELESEVNNFDRRVFQQFKTFIDSDEGDEIFDKRTNDLENSQDDIRELKIEFSALESSKKVEEINFKLEQAFDLADSATNKYGRTLNLKKELNAVSRDELDEKLGIFTRNYQSELDNGELITQSQEIINIADKIISDISKIDVSLDDQRNVNYHLSIYEDVKQTFTSINSYLLRDDENLVTNILNNYNSRNSKRVNELRDIHESYVENSAIAQDLEEFFDTIDEVEKELKEITGN